MTSAFLEYCQLELWPNVISTWHRLDVPSWDIYHPVLEECVSDVWKASQSTAQLSYLTLRPFAMLFLMLMEGLWEIAKVLFRVLLSQGWVHIKKGMIQLKAAAIWFYHFQMSLSRMELLGEAALIVTVIGLYYTYKWLRRQTYWQRFMRWYSEKKQRAIEKTTKFIDRVARVSLILAMALPHTAFLGGYVALKVILPSFVKWLAYDTYTTALISIWYPLIMTLSWVHDKRQSKDANAPAVQTTNNSVPSATRKEISNSSKTQSLESRSDRRPAYMRTTASQKSREHTTNKRYTSSFPRTSPPTPENPQRQAKEKAQIQIHSQKEGPSRPTTPTLNYLLNNEHEAATRYWLRYWVVYALIQSVGTLATMVPVFGNFVAQHPYVLHICCELKLLFFIWLFAMEKMIGSVVVQEDALMAKAMPLNLIHDYITPLLLEFEAVVAESVSEKTWTSLVHSKAQRVLEVFVMLKMISDDRKDWLLHFLGEGRTLLLPSLSLFMPSFITRFGVAYVQFIVPSAKSTRALAQAKKRSKQDKNMEIEDVVLLHLQYWIIHCLVSGFLGYFSAILWWIPFSAHVTFLVWCHLSFPKSIAQSYAVLETELVAFGLLPGKPELQIHETRTAQVLQAVYSRLPSASEIEKTGKEEFERTTGSVKEGEKPVKRDSTGEPETSHPPLDRTISVDSQETNVEISIREPRQLNQTEKIPRKQTAIRDDDQDDDESMPPIKPSESSTTAETSSTRITNDVASTDSSSTNGSATSKMEPRNLRRSSRQRRQVT